jgi:hypothetical protein
MEKLQRERDEARTQEKCTCVLVDTSAVVREAIASVKAEEPEDPHKYCRGGGGNNFHCGCKYDAQNHESFYP